MVADGLVLDQSSRSPRYQFNWVYGDLSGHVFADDKSKARSLIKKNLGIPANKRLPIGVEITRQHNVHYQQAVNEIYVNLQARS